MAKFLINLEETVYHTYEIELPDDVSEDEVSDYFYDLSAEDQKKGLVSTESFEWHVTQVKQV